MFYPYNTVLHTLEIFGIASILGRIKFARSIIIAIRTPEFALMPTLYRIINPYKPNILFGTNTNSADQDQMRLIRASIVCFHNVLLEFE